VVARSDWLQQRGFKGHTAKITAAAWSPNGALLATAGVDKSLTLWETRTQKALKKYDLVQLLSFAMILTFADTTMSKM